MGDKLRAGVVGLGHLGRHHARIYAEMADVELVGLCDRRPLFAEEMATAFPGVTVVTTPEEMVRRVDLVSVVTPTSTHLGVAEVFLRHGTATLVEKPLASTVKEAHELTNLAEKHGAMLQVGHIEEFNPALQASRHLIREPRFIEAHRMGSFSGRSLDVDVVLDLMIHDLDLILEWVGSEIRWIHAMGVPVLSSSTDMASVRIEFQNGTVANLTASRVSLQPQRRMRLFMLDRYLRLDFLERSVECVERVAQEDGSALIQGVPIEVKAGEPLRLELESFVDSVLRGAKPRVDGSRATRALEAVEAVKSQLAVPTR